MRWGVTDLYRFYNMPIISADGTLPPPPNPRRLQAFYLACAIVLNEREEALAKIGFGG
jgi:hypothetical protein